MPDYSYQQKYKMPPTFLRKACCYVILSLLCMLLITLNSHATTNKTATGTTHALAVTTIDTVYCTGSNTFGECDVSGWTDISQVAAGEFFSIGLDNSGDVFCAGWINYEPCDVSAFSGSNIVYIAAGSTHAVGIDDSGGVIGVGSTNYDKLDIGSWSGIIQVACGENHTVGLKSDNTVICAGNNYRAQCDVSSWTNISQISAGLQFTIGLQANTVLFTGWNNYSQGDFSDWPQGSITYISAGYEHSTAVDASNDSWATGQNQNGQCDVNSFPDIVKIVAGPTNTIGIKENGEILVVGSSSYDIDDLEGFQLINHYPEPVAGSVSTFEDYSATTIDLLSLATDYESHPLTVVTTNPLASNGVVINQQDGTYTYYPDTDHNGSDSFTYTVTDSQVYNYTGTAIVSVSITPVNDPPDYSCAQSITILEDHGLYTENSWACDLTTGAYNESDQSLSITWTCSNESLFLTKPTLTPSIADTTALTLSYAFGADENGEVTLTVVLSDDGGLDYVVYGAEDTITRTYILKSIAVNDFPTMTAANLTILEDAVSQFYTTWATNFGPGAYNEDSQAVSYTFTNDNTSLFYSQPFLDISGTTGSLAYTLVTDMFGESSLTVVIWDDGGTDNGGVDCLTQVFTIEILPVNDIPGFVISLPSLSELEDTSKTYTSWATSITQGTFNETDQQLSFSVNTSCPACFDVEPIIDPATGDMSYTLSADGSGAITVWVQLMDDGGTVNGGFDTVTHSFSITVTDINDPPDFILGTPEIIEDTNIISGWATDFTAGSAFETEQSLFLSITNTNPSLFTTQPYVEIATGDLTYTLVANIFGSTTVTIVLSDDGGTALGGIDTITKTFTLTVLPANDIPDFVIGPDRALLESQSDTYTSWATGLTCGAYNETEQTFSFHVTTSCPDCFDSEPFISASTGDLSYTLSADGSGPVTVWVSLTDSGGTANGGIDTVTYPFSISITDINDPPGCTLGPDPEVLEDSADTIGWATDITPANKFEIGQSLSFDLTNTNPSLFSSQPTIDSVTGNLSYTLAANEYGSATITFVLSDDGGTANGGVDRITDTFLFTVLPVNDAPNFDVGPDRDVLEGHGETYTAWATAITSGAYNETEQSLSFSLTTSCDACFSVQPVIYTSTGNLSYTLSADASDSITVWVSLTDSGGTSNGGVDTTTHPFHITITNVNDPPGCIFGANPIVLEDSSPNSITEWATDITPGNAYELEQSVSFSITNNNPSLFVNQPFIDNSTGNLSYTLAANEFGSATVTVVIFDDGGTADGGIDRITKTFSITVLPVNDVPGFELGPGISTHEGQGETYTAWATSLTQGAFNETDQKLTFSITTSCPECFISEPIIYTATGDLCYTLSADHNEDITVWVTLIDDGGTANGGFDTVTESFSITVISINDPPNFNIGPDREVLEDSSETYTSWATALTQGAFNETDQKLSFSVTTSCSECFIAEPIIYTASGNLTYTLAADFFGEITVWVALMDDGGTANGGIDTVTHSFSISIVSINDPPGFTSGGNLTVNEDSLNNTTFGWATDITPGNFYETGQSLSFSLTNSNPSLFSVQPTIASSTGDLSYTLAANEYGSATITVVLEDDGGTASGGENRFTDTFLITVEPVNDVPGFSVGPDRTMLEAHSEIYTSWATSISSGAGNESEQSLNFEVTTSCDECFSVQPIVYTSSGNLCYTLSADASGEVTVWVSLVDSGGTSNGGVDSVTHSFSISITNVNDPPDFTLGEDPSVLEDSTGHTISGWASNITPGNIYEMGQTVSFALTNTNPGLFTSQPQIDNQTGDLSYTLTTNEFGSATVTVVLSDNGGTANGGIDQIAESFVIHVSPVNDSPGFTKGSDRTILEGQGETVTAWAKNLTQGAFNETDQKLAFSITTSCPECFISEPIVYTATGDLSYTLSADHNEDITVWVTLIDDGGTANGGFDTLTESFSITVVSINDPPNFTIGPDLEVFEDSSETYTSWATAITQGAFNEIDQHLSFSVTTSCPECFITEPIIYTASGNLTYTLAADFFGEITVWVALMDDGGTANGGIDTVTQSFSISVVSINDPPGYTSGGNLSVNEDSVNNTTLGWATDITPGNYYEMGQSLSFSLTNSNPSLFSVQPTINSSTGDLSYTLAANGYGSATITVVLEDDGGTASGGENRFTDTFLITVEPVNDVPSFSVGPDRTILEDQNEIYTSWATNISRGAGNESDQSLNFVVSTSCDECFSVQPIVYTSSGNLCYTLSADVSGEVTVWVSLVDSGGTTNGGVDSVTHSFSITITNVNDPPDFTLGEEPSVLEDSTGHTISGWATNITSGNIYEMGQSVSFALTNTNPGLFTSQPQIDNQTGDLSYTLTTNEFGSATVTVVLSDNGGTAYSGIDQIAETFVIHVSPVNDSPGFTKGPDRYILEGDAETYTQWATNITAGPSNETEQSLAFSITTSCDECFDSVPVVYTSNGDLSYTLAADSGGMVTVWVKLMDDGGTLNGGIDTMSQTFVISITDVNDPPSFQKGNDQSVFEDASNTINGWAKEITPGNRFEVNQSLEFQLTCTNASLFSSPPTIDPTSGDLSYTLTTNEYGSSTVTVVLLDSGGSAYGGADRMTDTFLFTVLSVNDAPDFLLGPDRTILEDQGETYTSWTTSLTQGALNEIDQKLSFSITTSCPECFISEPIIYTATGDLCYTLSADHNDDITVWVTLIDDGGTVYAGVDRVTKTFSINVLSVNDSPNFTIGPDLEVLEDSSETYTSWATAITQGAFNEIDQHLSFSVTASCSACFLTEPSINNASGNLTYTLAADFFGEITVWVALMDDGGTVNGGCDTVTHSFSISVVSINDPPGYTSGGDLTVNEDSVNNTTLGWATDITPGNYYETGQSLSFSLTNSNQSLFSVQPTINSLTGDLSYTLAANEYGSATITVVLEDDGGTASGGENCYTDTFLITVEPVNDAPNFSVGPDLTILEDQNEIYTSWATNISRGAGNESDQSLNFVVSTSCDECFSVQPIVYTSSGDLCYTLSADASGEVTVWVSLVDSGGTTNGGVDTITHSFSITITNVNDPPDFTLGEAPSVLEDSTGHTISGWATNITPGNIYEMGQSVSFALTNTNPGLFTSQPQIDNQTGDLSYTLTTNEFGSATVTVVLSDNGGTAYSGIDQIAETFVIHVSPVNDSPEYTKGPYRYILEGDAETYTQWATNIAAGPSNETEQSLAFSITTSCDECFDSAPVVYTATGDLSYTLAADSGGVVTVWVSLIDDGGTLNGGIDTMSQTFVISITDVNDPPSFQKGVNPSVLEDTADTIPGWATEITPANKFESIQSLEFQLTCTNTNLFTTPPTIDAVSGDLSYTLSANEFGSTTVTVVLIDTGGTANSGVDRITETFVFNVLPVNDAPDFSIGPNMTTLEGHGETYTSWATSLTQGAYNETEQLFSFSVTTSCTNCFSSQPIVYTSTGDLCYTLSADDNGDITVWVALTDDGGTDDGGIDTITHSFVISITPVNDPPGFSVGANLTVAEDSTNNITSGWATDITPGNSFETGQTVSFSLTNTNSQLFSIQPTIHHASGTLSYTLAAHEFGSTTVTVVLSDNGGTANGGIDRITETFMITVTPVNDSPTMTILSNQTIDENSIAGPLAFTIGDIDADALTVTVSSSYTQLIPNSYIVFGDTNKNAYTNTTHAAFESIPLSITISPLPGKTGTSTITVSVTDGIDNDSTIFDITVNGIFHDGPGGVGNTLGGSSLQLWLAADELTEYNEGDAITAWVDSSGFNHTLSQSINCPTYTSTFSNHKPAIVFNGINNYFDNASALDLKNVSGLTVFAVINADTYSSNQSIIARDSNSNHGWACNINNSNKLFFSISESDSESVTILGTNDVTGSHKILSYIYDGLLNKSLDVYDGNTDDSEASDYTSPAKIQASGSDLRIGNDGNGQFFKGCIAELIVYNRYLSTTEHILVNNYLSSKYNIPLSEKDKYDGDTLVSGNYDWDVVGIGKESDGLNSIAISAGLFITNINFLKDNGDFLLLGHNRESNGITSANLPPDVNTAWEREWRVHKTDTNSNGGNIQLAFDLAMAGMEGLTPSTDFVLLKRSDPSESFVVFEEDLSFMGEQLQFTIDTTNLNTGDYLTLGSIINYALKFNGQDQSAISESSIGLSQTSFTIEYWSRRNATGEMYVMGQGPGIWEPNKNLHIGFSSTDTIIFGFDYTNTVETTSVYTDTKWHHYAFTYNQGTQVAEIYIDGVLSTTSVLSDSYSGTGQIYIGEAPGNINRYQGELDEIRIWNMVKNASNIFSDRNKNLQGNEPNLIYYWQLNQGIGGIAFEKTAIVNNLELSITTASPEWLISSLPMGYSATGHIESSGMNEYTGTGVTMNYHYHNNAEVYVTKVPTEANLLPVADTVFSKQYWVISRSDETSFDADITFVCDDDITGSNAKLAKLFWREIGSPGTWISIAYATSIDAGTETVVFNSIKRTGQFMIGYADFSPIPASGKALRFDGIEDWAVDETNRIGINNTSFTIEFWAKRTSIDSSHMAIGHSNYTSGLNIGFNADNSFQFTFGSNQATTQSYTDLNWHHWAITFDSSSYTQTVYCDGILITNNVAGEPYQLTGNFYIGCGSDSNNLFSGLLDDIRIWESARAQVEIQDNMYVPLNGNETDLMAYYRMDEPWSYSYITDVTTNSVNLEITSNMQQSDWVDSYAWSNRITDEDVNFTMAAGYDLEGGALAIASDSAPISGSFSKNNTAKTVTYSPNHNINGQDGFSFTVATATPIYPITMTIVPVNDPPDIGFIDTQDVAANAVADGITFTISDPESEPYSLNIISQSSDISIVPNNNILVDCVSGDCTACITPNTDMTGSLSITLTVSDPEGLTANRVFGLTVNALPEISNISDYTSTINTSVSIGFNVTDTESASGDLALSITISDTNILPITQTKLINSNGNCTVSLTPTVYSEGSVHVEIIAIDTHGYSVTTGFNLSIVSMPGSGYMMDFDGSYSAKTTKNLSFSDHTVEAWIKPYTNSWGGIVATDNNTGKWSQMLISPSGILRVQLFSISGHEKAYSGSTAVNDSKWHHVAYTFDATLDTLDLYVDGVKELTSVAVNQALTNFTLNEKVNIGVDSIGSNYFSGSIDEIRIWNIVRSIENFQENMCQKLDPATPNLIAYYRFDQSYGTTLYDITSNNNHCQLNGGGNWTLSKAPIGDESVYDYISGDGFSLGLAHSDGDLMTLTVTSGAPEGVHLYLINQPPNTNNVDLGTVITDRYWGAFISGYFDSLDFHYDYQSNPHASSTPSENSIAYRNDNSENWMKKAGSEDSGDGILNASGFSVRCEVILREVE